jgi:hypothetical protein
MGRNSSPKAEVSSSFKRGPGSSLLKVLTAVTPAGTTTIENKRDIQNVEND